MPYTVLLQVEPGILKLLVNAVGSWQFATSKGILEDRHSKGFIAGLILRIYNRQPTTANCQLFSKEFPFL
jgi:hypothetical protein